jgi:hypothetical protein
MMRKLEGERYGRTNWAVPGNPNRSAGYRRRRRRITKEDNRKEDNAKREKHKTLRSVVRRDV